MWGAKSQAISLQLDCSGLPKAQVYFKYVHAEAHLTKLETLLCQGAQMKVDE